MKRSGEQPKRDLAALVKHSQELSTDAKELAQTADELRRTADKLMAALEKTKRARVHR